MDGRCPALRTKWDVHRRRRSISLRYVVSGMILSRDPGAVAAEIGGDAARSEAILNKLVLLVSHDNDALTWKGGTVMIFDDGRAGKDLEARLGEPDLEDMFYAPYPWGRSGIPPAADIDPGRVRYQPFFDKMYGDCKKDEVEPRLVPVVWLPNHGAEPLKITSVNGVADKLKAVSSELDKLPDNFAKYITPSGGT